MPAFEVKVEGLAELQARLDQLKGPQAKRLMNRALREGAQVYKAAIEERTPERADLPSGTALPPGALRRDIRIKTYPGDDRSSVYAVGPGKFTARAMRWLEFGHRLVRGGYSKLLANGKSRGPGQVIGFVPANPVMRAAFEGSASEATAAIAAKLKQDLDNLDRGRPSV